MAALVQFDGPFGQDDSRIPREEAQLLGIYYGIFVREVERRSMRDFARRLSAVHLLERHDQDDFDYNFSTGLNKQQMKEL